MFGRQGWVFRAWICDKFTKIGTVARYYKGSGAYHYAPAAYEPNWTVEMQPLTWYMHRVAKTSVAEIYFRVVRVLKTQLQLIGFCRANPSPPAVVSSVSDWLHKCTPAAQQSTIRAAERIVDGKIEVFAVNVDWGNGFPVWNKDPLTQTCSPRRFSFSMNIDNREAVGDIKYLWEQNRHCHLTVLAQAFSFSKEERYIEAIHEHLQSWLEQCPYLVGPNWTSSLELGIRLMNWAVMSQIVGERGLAANPGHGGWVRQSQWLRSIYQHVHFIRGRYSRFSSANNHLIGEAAGAYVATCTWPAWSDFNGWRSEAKDLLIEAASKQTHPDGVNCEQAVAYQQFVLDFFILSGLVGGAREEDFPEEYWRAVERMLEYLQALRDVAGNVPMLGDSDDGVVVRLSHEPDFCPYRSLLATGALLFKRPDFAAAAGKLDDKTRLLVGDEGWEALLQKGQAEGFSVRRTFPDGGYYILGHQVGDPDEVRLLVDAGPLGYLSIAGHGHADALAVYLSVAGREFLIDPGTYTYNSRPAWRAWFRSTRAHNTVTVDGQDQSVQGGSFMWLKHARARCLEIELAADVDRFVGEHDGYSRLDDPVIHRREIDRHGCVFEVADTLICKGRHVAEQWWHFSEHCVVRIDGNVIEAVNDGARIRLVAGSGSLRLYRGSEDPIAGWVSRRFDTKEPATSVCVSHEVGGTATLTTMIECIPGAGTRQ